MKIGPRQKFFFKLGISLSLVIYLAYKISWRQVGEALLHANPKWIALGYLLMLGILYLQALRWKILLNIPELPVSKYLHFIFVGIFYRIIMPGSLSADMLKVVLFGKKYNKPLHESTLIFFSQFLGMAIQWVVGLIGLFYFGAPLLKIFSSAELSKRKLILMGLVGIVALIVIPFIPVVRSFMGKMFRSMKATIQIPGVLKNVIWVTVLIQVLMIGSAYCIFRGAGVSVPVLVLCFQMALANVLVALPISINGLGVVDYLNVFLFQTTLGTPAHQIIAVSVISYSLLVINGLLGGAWILLRNVSESRTLKS